MSTTKHFFTTGTHGIEYTTPDEMAAFLDAFPEEIEQYWQKQLEMAQGMMTWGDYRTAKELLTLTLDALAIHDEHQGQKVLK